MRDLSASIDMNAPAGFTVAFLNSHIAERAAAGGEPQLHLKYPLKLAAGLVLERDVTVHVNYEPQTDLAPAQLAIGWHPDETALFPTFHGSLIAVERSERACTVTIEGQYDVPGGIAGVLFDAVVGFHIAHATLDDLLDGFRVAVETDYENRMRFG